MIAILLALCILPRGDLFVREQATALERNYTYHGDESERLFIQVLAWHEEHVWFWLMDNSGALHPDYDHASRLWVLRFVDKDGTCRAVYSRSYGERHLMFDVEVVDRELLPVEGRRKLRGTNERNR